jgi:hypothetical protein
VTDFKVGDKVTHNVRGDAEITYGPYTDTFGRTHSVIRLTSGRELAVPTSNITVVPKFAVGDKVAYEYGGGGTLVAGPFKSEHHDEPIWVVEKVNGTHMTPTENALRKVDAEPTPEIKVGDRVRVLRATFAESTVGRVGKVVSTTETWREADNDLHRYDVEFDDGGSVYAAEVELVDEPTADTYEYDSVVYDLSAAYNDRDNEPWTFKRFGSAVRGGCNGFPPGLLTDPLELVVEKYGPLRKI